MKKERKGFIVLIAMIIALSISLMVAGLSVSVLYRSQNALRYINSVKSYYIADAGIKYGRKKFKDYIPGNAVNPASAAYPITDTGEGFTLNVTATGDMLQFTSTAKVNNSTRTIISKEECDEMIKNNYYYYHTDLPEPGVTIERANIS